MTPHWCRNPEFAQSLNAGSVVAPHVESFLNIITAQVRDKLGDSNESLRQDIDTFRKQEGNHLRLHLGFNKRLYEFGYAPVRQLENEIAADLKRFRATKSLRFNMAYCTGFECFAHYLSKYVFEGVPHLFEGADSTVTELWRWHVAEEYEHRSVCFDAYARLFGSWKSLGYLHRVYGLIYSAVHLMAYNKRMIAALLEQDRSNMTPAEVTRSKARERAVNKEGMSFFFSHMMHVILPFYDPRKERPSPGVLEMLASYD